MQHLAPHFKQLSLPTINKLLEREKNWTQEERLRVDRMVQKRELLAILEVTKGRTDIPLTKSERELLLDTSI